MRVWNKISLIAMKMSQCKLRNRLPGFIMRNIFFSFLSIGLKWSQDMFSWDPVRSEFSPIYGVTFGYKQTSEVPLWWFGFIDSESFGCKQWVSDSCSKWFSGSVSQSISLQKIQWVIVQLLCGRSLHRECVLFW